MYSVYSNWKTSSAWHTPSQNGVLGTTVYTKWVSLMTSVLIYFTHVWPSTAFVYSFESHHNPVIQGMRFHFTKLLCYQPAKFCFLVMMWYCVVHLFIMVTTDIFQNKFKWCLLSAQHGGILFILGIHNFRLHCVNYEAKFIAQCFMSVGHADLGDVGPTDIVPFRPILQIVCA